MSVRVPPPSVGRLEAGLARVLATSWSWVAAAGILLIAAAAQSGFGDSFLESIAIVVPVAFVVRVPRVAAAVAVVAALGFFFPVPVPVAAGAGLLVVCGVAAYRLTAVEVCVVGGLFLVNAVTPFNTPDPAAGSYLLLAVVTAALGFGRLLRSRNRIVAEHQTLATAHVSAMHDHLLLADRAAIARELHDVVAHHISHIAIRAETARYTTPDLPDLAGVRLTEIGDSARAALADMRRILTVLRSPTPSRHNGHDGPGRAVGPPSPVLEPLPGLDRLDTLVESARRHGTAISVTVSGPAASIPADTDLVAYRVVQESLTNARRHAPGADVRIDLDYTPELLRLTIHNDCPAPAGSAPGTGLGLLGMRERVDAVGGSLRHGPLPDGGFTVAAQLPLRPARQRPAR
jgi:signal transduction histidine kinase